MAPKIYPIRGFPELSHSDSITMEKLKSKIHRIYQKYDYTPLETRIVEDGSALNQKGIDCKDSFSIYRFSERSKYDPMTGGRDLVLRSDLTVPFARYVAENNNSLSFPLKRYTTDKVYGCETTKHGPVEVCQSDVDVININGVSLAHDSEFPAIISEVFTKVFNLSRFKIRISNRKLLEGLFQIIGLKDAGKIKQAIKVIDKIEKVPEEVTRLHLEKIGVDTDSVSKLFTLFRETIMLAPLAAVSHLEKFNTENKLYCEGVSELRTVVEGVFNEGVDQEHILVDPRVARNPDYYTGTIYNTVLLDHPELGSVCGGGRYANLVSDFSNDKHRSCPGVGVSISLSHLFPTLISHGYINSEPKTYCSVLVTVQNPGYLPHYQNICRTIRRAGINAGIYLDHKKLRAQLQYARTRGYKYVIIANDHELDDGKVTFRNMTTNEETIVEIANVVSFLQSS